MHFRPTIFAALILLFLPGAMQAQTDQPVPVLMGYLSAPPTRAQLMIDGCPVRISKAKYSICGDTQMGFDVHSGVPDFPPGAELAVYGKWDKKNASYTADSVCAAHQPSTHVSGAAVIDGVRSSGSGTEILADGRRLRLPSRAGLVKMDPPFAAGSTPRAGDWLSYSARRQKDGSFLVDRAELGEAPFGPADKHVWKPLEFTPPSPRGDGSFKFARLQRSWKLPYDAPTLARLQRVGESVVPAWEKALPDNAPDKWRFGFYILHAKHAGDCLSFPNGTIFVTEKTAALLTNDAQLAALLAGCVSEVLEEQALRTAPDLTTFAGKEAVAFLAPTVVAAPALLASGIYGNHVENMLKQQSARVGLT